MKTFGAPVVVALNRFPQDSQAELKRLADFCGKQQGASSAVSEAFTVGGPGAKELAERVVETIAANPAAAVRSVYSPEESLAEKIRKVAEKIYGAAEVSFSEQAKTKLDQFAKWGYDKLPVCIAKTQYSLSDDPKLSGRAHRLDPAGQWTLLYRPARDSWWSFPAA